MAYALKYRITSSANGKGTRYFTRTKVVKTVVTCAELLLSRTVSIKYEQSDTSPAAFVMTYNSRTYRESSHQTKYFYYRNILINYADDNSFMGRYKYCLTL